MTDIPRRSRARVEGSSRVTRRRACGALALGLLVSAILAASSSAESVGSSAASPVLRAQGSQPDAGELIRKGVNALTLGDLEAADAAWGELRLHYPWHPAAATFEVRTLELRQILDTQGTEFEKAIRSRADEALSLSEEWLKRSPDDPQALFYAGQAKFDLMVLEGLRGRYYRAGTRGEAARKHLERALELDPDLVDAKLPLGNYYYYASIATRYIRWFSWLWFVPTGERDLGIAYIDEVSRNGDLLRYRASVLLAELQLYLEDQPELAKEVLERMRREYPESSYVAFELIELRMIQQRYDATIQLARALEESDGQQFGDAIRRTMAKTWRARAELYRGNPTLASSILEQLEATLDDLTPWCQRWVLVTRGQILDLEGLRDQAISHYKQVLESKSRWSQTRSGKLARAGLETPFVLDIPASTAGQ